MGRSGSAKKMPSVLLDRHCRAGRGRSLPCAASSPQRVPLTPAAVLTGKEENRRLHGSFLPSVRSLPLWVSPGDLLSPSGELVLVSKAVSTSQLHGNVPVSEVWRHCSEQLLVCLFVPDPALGGGRRNNTSLSQTTWLRWG